MTSQNKNGRCIVGTFVCAPMGLVNDSTNSKVLKNIRKCTCTDTIQRETLTKGKVDEFDESE